MPRWKPDAEGRLLSAALELFDEQGYEATTVADIAGRAGLTKRTFFRYYADKREVLFGGAGELEELWVRAVSEAPADAGPMPAVAVGLDAVAAFFGERHAFARVRARVVAANPELQERELSKLERLASSLAGALEERGVAGGPAALAAHTGVQIFHVSFARWIAQDDPDTFGSIVYGALEELRQLLLPGLASS